MTNIYDFMHAVKTEHNAWYNGKLSNVGAVFV